VKRIIVKDITKRFRIGFVKHQSALGRTMSMLSGKEPTKHLWALKGVSFEVQGGEIVGLIGNNGAGKSTLLRIMAGIYTKTSGTVSVNGRMVPIIGLGHGLHERLSMRDNIYLACSLFNMDRDQIAEKFDSIVKFSQLGDFLDTKLYQFSDGMKQRLAFSTAMAADPQILLLDEVFEVGDRDFREKSAQRIKKLVKKGAAVILVTHELRMIDAHCSRVIWLKDGRVFLDGPAKAVLEQYMRENPKKKGKAGKKAK